MSIVGHFRRRGRTAPQQDRRVRFLLPALCLWWCAYDDERGRHEVLLLHDPEKYAREPFIPTPRGVWASVQPTGKKTGVLLHGYAMSNSPSTEKCGYRRCCLSHILPRGGKACGAMFALLHALLSKLRTTPPPHTHPGFYQAHVHADKFQLKFSGELTKRGGPSIWRRN